MLQHLHLERTLAIEGAPPRPPPTPKHIRVVPGRHQGMVSLLRLLARLQRAGWTLDPEAQLPISQGRVLYRTTATGETLLLRYRFRGCRGFNQRFCPPKRVYPQIRAEHLLYRPRGRSWRQMLEGAWPDA